MRKLFLLIPALALTLMANATKWEIDPTYNPDWSSASQNIEHTIGTNIGDGDTIVLRQGIYVEPYSISINHPVVIMADVNASPVIQRGSYFGVYANVKFIGIKFDGGNTAEYAVYVQNGTTKSIIFEDCEFTGFTKDIITGSSSNSNLDSCVINNCYFHDNVRSAVKFETSSSRIDGLLSCNFLKVTNSTITNVSALSGALIDNRNNGNESGTDSLYVDHVTIYNWTGGSNGAIMAYKSHHVEITNCIFAEPADQTYRATYCYGGIIKNCLSYHLTTDPSKNAHRQSSGNPALVDNFTADPLFVNAAEGNYALADLSPARNAGTDGSNLGDPRWNAPCSLPHTDFATPYLCSGADATISGNIWRNENKYLYGNGGSKEVYGTAEWRIHATRACAVQVALNMDPDAAASGHVFMVEIFNATDNKVGEVAESGYSSSTVDGIDLSGLIYLPAAGDYRIKLSNSQTYSSAVIKGITLSYVGGAEQAMPGTTNISDAWFSEEGTRADGKISFSTYENAWVKWNVKSTSGGTCNVKLYIENTTDLGHAFVVNIYETTEGTPLFSETWNSSYSTTDPIEIDCGSFTFAAGVKYIIKVTNNEFNSEAKVINVVTTYLSGGTVNIPANPVPFADATLSQYASIDGSGYLHFADDDHVWLMADQYAKWNIHANAGVYHFIAHACSPNDYSNIQFRILQNDNEIYSYKPQYTFKKADETITSPDWFLDGDYTLEVSNPANHSHGYLLSLAASAIEDEFIIFDENAEDMSVINANNGVNNKKLVLKRSFVAGMYNTICMPFNEDSNTQLTKIFGEGYDLLEMTGATIEGSVLTLDFATPANKIKYGRPYLIKPTKNVVNPVFNAHTVSKSVSHLVQPEASSADASFIGIYTPTVLDQQRDLFVGQNNKVHFPSNDNKLKGLRAYFHVTANAQAIKRARIVTREEVITEIDLVNGENNGVIKTIENGQLIINLDGIRFNIMGTKIQ